MPHKKPAAKTPKLPDYPILRGPKNVRRPSPRELERLDRAQRIRRITRKNPATAV